MLSGIQGEMLPKQRECVHNKWALAKINISVSDPYVFGPPGATSGSVTITSTDPDPDPSLSS
jgi:hypothetical protein